MLTCMMDIKWWYMCDIVGVTECKINSHSLRQTQLNSLFFQDILGKPAPERLNQSGFDEARDDGVAVASAGPYSNHLHLVPGR